MTRTLFWLLSISFDTEIDANRPSPQLRESSAQAVWVRAGKLVGQGPVAQLVRATTPTPAPVLLLLLLYMVCSGELIIHARRCPLAASPRRISSHPWPPPPRHRQTDLALRKIRFDLATRTRHKPSTLAPPHHPPTQTSPHHHYPFTPASNTQAPIQQHSSNGLLLALFRSVCLRPYKADIIVISLPALPPAPVTRPTLLRTPFNPLTTHLPALPRPHLPGLPSLHYPTHNT